MMHRVLPILRHACDDFGCVLAWIASGVAGNGQGIGVDSTGDSVTHRERRGSWEMIVDMHAGTYYYSYTTQETTWEPPAVFTEVWVCDTAALLTVARLLMVLLA